jgi:acetyl esterase
MAHTEGIQRYVNHAKAAVGSLAGLAGISLTERRIRADHYAALVQEPYPPELSVRDTFVVCPGKEIFVRIYRPESPNQALPTIVYLHGGSFVAGSPQGHDFITASLAWNAGVQVISVHYRRAPENPYPAPLEDSYDVLCWAAREHRLLGIDPAKLAVAGDSAGGNLAAACALLARDKKGPLPALQLLLYPTLDADVETHSYIHNTNDAFLTRESMIFALKSYLQGKLDTPDGYALPMRADNHAHLPAALILVADHDPLMDDGIRYQQKLLADGTAAQLRVGKGLIHGFLRARRFCTVAEAEFQAMCKWVRDAFGTLPPNQPW